MLITVKCIFNLIKYWVSVFLLNVAHLIDKYHLIDQTTKSMQTMKMLLRWHH